MRPLIIYHKLTEDKIDTFIQMRINQLLEEDATEDVCFRCHLTII